MSEEKKDDVLEQCQAEREEYLNGWKRAKADLINYQKEEGRRLEQFSKFALESFLHELLTILDSFDLALSSSKDEETKKGVTMIKSQLEETLKRQGLERLSVREGDQFDPSTHEAVEEGEGESGMVLDVLVAGYSLHGKVIRAAKVKVGK
ncbi:MAG: nucleotide exchange factor GrpE [Candidatus Harrisonbacteria bacterium]|nr:nucleotide exchange factor GrpE [Candidatus Harrisonbacteria bacterium]